MKQVTKNLFTYQADIHASAAEIGRRLPVFETIGEHQRTTWGFVEVVPDAGNRVLSFPGGWALCYRDDTKLLPAATVRQAVDAECITVAESTGRRPGKKECKEIQEAVIHDLLAQAFVRTRLTYVIYSARTQRLLVNTGSQKVADAVVTALVHALESVKTSTVHVSEPVMGLTKRLSNWLADDARDNCFGDFDPVDEVILTAGDRKWAVKMSASLATAAPALTNAMQQDATVDSMRFAMEDGTRFRITQALRLAGVKHVVPEAPEDGYDDQEHEWAAQLAIEVSTIDRIFDELLRLLSPEQAQADKPVAATDLDDLF